MVLDQILQALEPYLTEELLENTLKKIQTLTYGMATTDVPEEREGLTFSVAWPLQNLSYRNRVEALSQLIPHLSGELHTQALEEAFALAQSIENAGLRTYAACKFLPYLASDLQRQGLEAILAMLTSQQLSDNNRASILAEIAPYLTDELLAEALTIAYTIEDVQTRVRALRRLAQYLTGDSQVQVLKDALAAVQMIKWKEAEELAALAPHLNGNLLSEALAITKTFAWRHQQLLVLNALAPYLSGQLLEDALQTAQAIEDQEAIHAAKAALAPYLRGNLLDQAWEKDHRIRVAFVSQLKGARWILEQASASKWRFLWQIFMIKVRLWQDKRFPGSGFLLASRPFSPEIDGDDIRKQRLAFALLMDGPKSIIEDERSRIVNEGLELALSIRDEVIRAYTLLSFLQLGIEPSTILSPVRQSLVTGIFSRRDVPRQTILELCADHSVWYFPPDEGNIFDMFRSDYEDVDDDISREYSRDGYIDEYPPGMKKPCLFSPPVLAAETLAAIAVHILEICQEWEWL